MKRQHKTSAVKAAFIILIAALTLAGCSGKSEAVSFDPQVAAQKILDGVAFNDSLIEAKGDVAREWYKLDDKVEDFAIYVSGSGGTAEEIAVIKSSDIKSAEAIVKKRIEDLEFRFKDYVPEEMVKLGDPVIVSKGDTVIMVLTDDADTARKIAGDLFK